VLNNFFCWRAMQRYSFLHIVRKCLTNEALVVPTSCYRSVPKPIEMANVPLLFLSVLRQYFELELFLRTCTSRPANLYHHTLETELIFRTARLPRLSCLLCSKAPERAPYLPLARILVSSLPRNRDRAEHMTGNTTVQM
jgi:hypothetical protein